MPKEKKSEKKSGKESENKGSIKKTGKLKKLGKIAAGLFVILFLIGVFSEDTATTTQTSDLSEAEDSITDTDSIADSIADSISDSVTDSISDSIADSITDSIADTNPSEKEEEIGTEQDTETDDRIPETDISDSYIYSLTEYPFQDEKNGEKIVELYEKALDAEREEFICLTEEKKQHLLSSTEVWYHKSLDTDHAPFRYYGEANKDGYPDGWGMLVKNWDELYRDAEMFMAEEEYEQQEVCVEIVYIGEFKKGFKEGYGINFGMGGLYDLPVIAEEGKFLHGKMEGNGVSYIGLAGDSFNEEFNDMLAEAYLVEYSESTNSGLLFPTVVKSNLYYEGMYKKGRFDGTGKEYYLGAAEENQQRLKYEGEFKEGHYSGTGILYFENGAIWYKGEFKNGKYNGKGTLYDEQGNVLHKGKFEKGDVK